MRKRLIAILFCFFGSVAGVQAAQNVTADVTYDLATGRANYYFWNKEAPPAYNYNTTWAISATSLICSRPAHHLATRQKCRFT